MEVALSYAMYDSRPYCLILLVVVTEDDTQFPQNLYNRIKRTIHEFVVLSRSCLEGDLVAVDTMMQSRMVSRCHSNRRDKILGTFMLAATCVTISFLGVLQGWVYHGNVNWNC